MGVSVYVEKMSDGGHDFAGMYAEGIPPWQIDRPQPEVIRLIEQRKFESAVLDLGCGTGDNTIELARHGLVVNGLDAVPEALERARKKTEQAGLKQSPEFVLGDALRLDESGLKARTVLDCALFHTFSDEERGEYIRGLEAVLSQGGRLHILSFSELEKVVVVILNLFFQESHCGSFRLR